MLLAVTAFVLCLIAMTEGVVSSLSMPFLVSLEQSNPSLSKYLRFCVINRNALLISAVVVQVGLYAVFGVLLYIQFYPVLQPLGLTLVYVGLFVVSIALFVPPFIATKRVWQQVAKYAWWLFQPVIWLLTPLAKLVTCCYVQPRTVSINSFSMDDLQKMVQKGQEEGQVTEAFERVMKNLCMFHALQAKKIMTPRTVVFAVSEDLTLQSFFDEHRDMPFSRIPVYAEEMDNVTGFVLKDELLITLAESRDNASQKLSEIKRPIKAVPGTVSMYDLFEFVVTESAHIVLVVDEYGGMEGVATMEDVIETLIGQEIVDEIDTTVDMQLMAKRKWARRARGMGIETKKKGGINAKAPEESGLKKQLQR